MKLQVTKPHINFSNLEFTTANANEVIYGLKAVKDLGYQAIKQLLAVRERGGKFDSVIDIMQRIDLSKFGKKNMEILAESGCLDVFALDRVQLAASMNKIVKRSGDYFAEQDKPQQSLFASFDNDLTPFWRQLAITTCKYPAWESLIKEKTLLGEYLSYHPLNFYQADRSFFRFSSLAQITKDGEALVLVSKVQTRLFKKSNKHMTFITLEDASMVCNDVFYDGDIQMPLNVPVLVTIRKSKYQGRQRINVVSFRYLHELRMRKVKKLVLRLAVPQVIDTEGAKTLVQSLADACKPQGEVAVDFQVSLGKQTICIETNTRTAADNTVVQKLQNSGGMLKYR